ncbi:hypothetical protein KFE25_012875 [Diacronema lutheri]|uniref:Uncharacterized protein n=1 Tax=Diacronema lutheri TaxID=2081491 RepID=A0A8J5XAE2_DIALT|nr:hypothetical protein KFE25_012875 [Diacronema lutheri]
MAGITLVVLAATSATAATRVAPACAWHGVPSHARVSAFPVRRPCPPAVAALGARRARPMLAESCTPVVPARPHGGLAALLRVVQGAFYALWLGLCSRVAKGIEEIRKSSRPAKIFLVRHGQSRGNVDETLYSVIADHDMELTELGREQARCAGRFLRAITGDGPVHCFHSPYRRASQTLAEIIGDFDPAKVATREEVLLREQEFGNFQDVELIRRSKAERRRYGRFWYRFQNGESGADVHNRAADFLSTLFRQMDLSSKRAPHYIILAHGLFIRLLCMRYLGWQVAQFEQVWNPRNCETWVLERRPDGRYHLTAAYYPVEGPDGSLEMIESPLHYGPDRSLTIPQGMRRPRSAPTSLAVPDAL